MKTIITIMILFALSFFYYAVKMYIQKGKTKSSVSESHEEDGKKQDKDKMEDGRWKQLI